VKKKFRIAALDIDTPSIEDIETLDLNDRGALSVTGSSGDFDFTLNSIDIDDLEAIIVAVKGIKPCSDKPRPRSSTKKS